ncbi:MAG: exodeoxyribonuclease VII large subunit, partial [Desulfobacteraceae bacterium]|nr:exodeoxyribonuclease VII large subunit [Desulfobacteraceae bacterium]
MSNTGIRQIYSVSILTKEIKSLLEDKYPFVWIMGEISNFACPASGHSYFSLKDENAVINCVMFRNQKLSLKFEPENGMTIVGLARLSLYEPRGSYQLIFEHMEPEGVGANQVAFEQLKRKLEQEGLFKPEHKKLIPFLPSVINVITSATGAAVKDIINISKRRFANCRLEIVPVQVQGEGAELQICQAIDMVNEHKRSDVIILARGGGSMEDLTAFNSENVARAIFNSRIPVITGIGHETDFTIADFVSDLRAPTPSAAAELALPDKSILNKQINDLQFALSLSLKKKI